MCMVLPKYFCEVVIITRVHDVTVLSVCGSDTSSSQAGATGRPMSLVLTTWPTSPGPL